MLLLYIYHYHIFIDHKDDISCLQLEKNSEAVFFFTTLCLLPSFYHIFPTEECWSIYFYRHVVCVRKWIKVLEVGRGSEGGCCTINRPILSPLSPLLGWAPWALTTVTVTGPHEQWLRLSLCISLQADSGPRGASRERLGAEGTLPQEKGGPSVPAHLLGNPYAFGLTPGAVMQDSRFQPLKWVTHWFAHFSGYAEFTVFNLKGSFYTLQFKYMISNSWVH